MTGFSHTAVELFDARFGPYMVPVKPGSKAPIGSSVTAKCASREEALRWDAAGLGIGLRGGDFFLWIDNDFGRLFTRLIEQAVNDLGVVSLRRFVDSPRHRRDAFLFRVAPPTKTLSLKFLDPVLGVEGEFGLRGSGQQALIAGIHPPTGARYLTSFKIRQIEDIPEVPASAFSDAFQWIVDQALKAGLQVVAGMPGSGSLVYAVPRALGLPHQKQTRDTQTGSNPSLARDLLDPAEISQLLGWLPNDPTKWSKALGDFLSVYQNWVDVCYAIIGATGGSSEGRALWVWWSDQQPQSKVRSSDQWDHCMRSAQTGGVRVGGTFLIELAQKFAWDAYHKAAAQTFADHPIDLPDNPRPLWDAFRARWVIWSRKSRYINLATGGIHDTRGFNMACNAQLSRLWSERYGTAKGRPSNISVFVDRQTDLLHVEGITYHPGKPKLFCDAAGFDVFNEWTPPIFARFPVSAAEIKLWLDHLLYVLKAPHLVELFVRWCAFLVQHPDDKPNWGWLILSRPGLGKDTLIVPMRVALGHDNVQPFDFTRLGSAHNYFARSKLLIASEIAEHDNPRDAKKNFAHFKIYAARPPETVMVNPKGLPPYQIPNRCGAVLFSNEFNSVAFDNSDRRLLVVSSLDIQPRPKAHYETLHDWLDNQNGAVMVANYLNQLPLTQADIHELKGPAPMTAVKGTLAALNSNVVYNELMILIRDARTGGGRFNGLVVTVDALRRPLSSATGYEVSTRDVSRALYEAAARGEVFPALSSPSEPDRPGNVSGKNGEHERFWLLADVHPQTGVKLRDLKGQELFDAFNLDVSQTSQFPPNVVPIRAKKPASKKGFSTTVPDDPV